MQVVGDDVQICATGRGPGITDDSWIGMWALGGTDLHSVSWYQQELVEIT